MKRYLTDIRVAELCGRELTIFGASGDVEWSESCEMFTDSRDGVFRTYIATSQCVPVVLSTYDGDE